MAQGNVAQEENDFVLFEKEAVVAWFQKHRPDVRTADVEGLLENQAMMFLAAGAFAAGYLKSKERGGRVPTFLELEAEKAAKKQ